MNFTVTDAQADQILNALAAQPYRDSAPLINELVQQVQAQKQQANMQQQQRPDAALQGGGALNGAGAPIAQ